MNWRIRVGLCGALLLVFLIMGVATDWLYAAFYVGIVVLAGGCMALITSGIDRL